MDHVQEVTRIKQEADKVFDHVLAQLRWNDVEALKDNAFTLRVSEVHSSNWVHHHNAVDPYKQLTTSVEDLQAGVERLQTTIDEAPNSQTVPLLTEAKKRSQRTIQARTDIDEQTLEKIVEEAEEELGRYRAFCAEHEPLFAEIARRLDEEPEAMKSE